MSVRGKELAILAATTPATSATGCTAFQAYGNSLNLRVTTVTGGAGTLTITIRSSTDGTTYSKVMDADGEVTWTNSDINTAGTYDIPLSGLSTIPNEYYQVYYACTTGAGTIAIRAVSWEDPAGNALIDVGNITVSLDTLDDWDNTHDSAIGADGPPVMLEAKDFDGAALPNNVSAQGDAVRAAGTLYGVAYNFPVNEDGSKTPIVAEDAAHASGDLGYAAMSVRADDPEGTSGASGDYQPILTDEHGCLHSSIQMTAEIDACNATTGWTVLGNDTINLTTSTNHVYGTNSLSFDKTDGAADTIFAGIQKTISSTNLNKYINHGQGFFGGSMYLSALTDVAYAWFRAGTDSSNYNEWRVDDDNLVAGQWMNLRGQLGAPYVSTGNGWDSSAVTYVAIGVAFDAETDALAAILVDNIWVSSGIVVNADMSSTTQLNTPNINVHRLGGAPIDEGAGNVGNATQRVTLAGDDANAAAIKTALQIMDDWDESDRAKVNPIAGQAGIAANAGAMDALTTRVTVATDDTHFGTVGASADVDGVVHGQLRFIGEAVDGLETDMSAIKDAVEIMDDWDESDRAKVNIIVGQAGITANAGAVAANTPRVTLASDDPGVALLATIDADTSTIAGDTTSLDAKAPALGTAAMTGSTPVTIATDDTMFTALDTAVDIIAGDTTSLDAKQPALGTAVMTGSSPVTIATDDTMFAALDAAVDIVAGDTTSLDAKQPALGTAAMAASSPVTIASDDTLTTAIKTALEIMDDWDDGSDRCQVDIAAKTGVTVSSALYTVPGSAGTGYKSYIDTSFVTGDSPQTHDINTDLGRNATQGYITCDGAGNISVQYSESGAVSGEDAIILKSGETLSLDGANVDQITVTWVTDSAYRIYVR